MPLGILLARACSARRVFELGSGFGYFAIFAHPGFLTSIDPTQDGVAVAVRR